MGSTGHIAPGDARKQTGPIDRFLSAWRVLKFTLAQHSQAARRAKFIRSRSCIFDLVTDVTPFARLMVTVEKRQTPRTIDLVTLNTALGLR